jgi:hypothetical protein
MLEEVCGETGMTETQVCEWHGRVRDWQRGCTHQHISTLQCAQCDCFVISIIFS